MQGLGAVHSVQAAEYAYVLGVAILLPALRWLLDTLFYMPLSRRLVLPPTVRATGGSIPEKLQSRILKLREAQWKLTCYGMFVAWGLLTTWHQPWFSDTKLFWAGWPSQPMTMAMRVMYGTQLGYYTSTILTLALWEVPRKDFHVMMLHHCAAVVLLTFSYVFNYTRVGCMIMLLHDVNDVLLEVAKIFNYLKIDWASNAVFGVFVAAWAGLRLFCFPYYIIRSTMFEVRSELGRQPPFYWMFNALLLTLYCLHLYWFRFILKVVQNVVFTGKGTDVREEEDND